MTPLKKLGRPLLHNLNRQAAHEELRRTRKRKIKADLIGRHRARSRVGGPRAWRMTVPAALRALRRLPAAAPVPDQLPIGSPSQRPLASAALCWECAGSRLAGAVSSARDQLQPGRRMEGAHQHVHPDHSIQR
jgi:hypothetical protein